MKHLSLQAKLIGCILIISTVLVVLSSYLLNSAWQENRRADKFYRLSKGAYSFIVTLKDLTFERGRTNVVLSSKKSISANDRIFIDSRRKLVDDNMNEGLEWLSGIDQQLFKQLQEKYMIFISLRKKADEVIGLNTATAVQRNKIRHEWFRHSTQLIHEIIETLEIIAGRQNLSGYFKNYYMYLIYTLEFRDRIGQSGSIMTSAIASDRSMSPLEYDDFNRNLVLADYLWSKIEVVSAAINDPGLTWQKLVVQQKYYELYRPLLEETIRQFYSGAIPPERVKQLQELSVPAFDSVFLLMDQIKEVIRLDINKQKQGATKSLTLALIQFVIAMSVILYSILYFRNKLFMPLNNLTCALEKIHAGETVPKLAAELSRSDEIGQLAEGIKMLQLSINEERNLLRMTEIRAITDELTGCYNRHFLEKSIENIIARSDRYNESLTLAMFDLDHFKNINDK